MLYDEFRRFDFLFWPYVLFFFLILEENGVNLNTQKTDDTATEETKLPMILETENSGSL